MNINYLFDKKDLENCYQDKALLFFCMRYFSDYRKGSFLGCLVPLLAVCEPHFASDGLCCARKREDYFKE